MKIILSQQCESLTGMLDSGLGYFIVKRGKSFYSQRSRHYVPEDGHWRFIVTCAQLAQNRLHITDVKVDWSELQTALWEAKHFVASEQVEQNYIRIGKKTYDARDILNLKTTFSL